ncbi:MAG: ribonuclease HIII, partial [Myxococcales bacterium]|nr:ribonuclease HIII [Myxococcales bacterium]
LQGKEADVYRGLLGDETPEARPYARALAKHPRPAPAHWIGTDEAGKGDWLGPLVVAGVAVGREQLELLWTLGIDDSKALNDNKLPDMAREIAATCPWEVIVINPARYNELYAKMRNINRMLEWAHAKVIEGLLEKGAPAEWILVDKFGDEGRLRRAMGPLGRQVAFQARTKAEEDPAVGAASVLARASYLKGMERLSARFGVRLHGGAGAPALAAGRRFIETVGRAELGQVAKLHFRSTEQAGG